MAVSSLAWDCVCFQEGLEGIGPALFRKADEARISEAFDSGTIVAIPGAPTISSLPTNRRSLRAVVALLSALTSPALAFASVYLNTTLRTPDEVVSFLNIPVLAAMPQNGPDGKKLEEGIYTHVSRFL